MADSFSDGHAMLWRNGTATDLTDRGIDNAIAINDAGAVLAGASGGTACSTNLIQAASARSTCI